MHSSILFSSAVLTLTFFFPLAVAAGGLYTKNSPVLQVDARSYNRLIAKSNYTSILEFYAPWCGHCQNLKPAYEKAATSLAGLAKVAAINCDEETNKPFCSSMGVQGFPTLKIVKPSMKGEMPVVEDYQGPRTARGINDAVMDKIPMHVSKLKYEGLEAWLAKKPERPKAILFSEKGNVSPLVKALAIDFLNKIDIAQIRSTEKEAAQKYGITMFPTLVLVQGADREPITHSGAMNKVSLVAFLTQAAQPNPDALPDRGEEKKPKSKKESSATKAKTSKTSAASAGASTKPADEKLEASCPMGHTGPNPHAASETIEVTTPPTESPYPNVAADSPPTAQLPVEPAPRITTLEDEASLQKSCLHTKAAICVLAFTPSTANQEKREYPGVTDLSGIAHKHKQRGAKIFPFYSIPDTNAAGQNLLSALGARPVAGGLTLLATNAKRGWWSLFEGDVVNSESIELWVDGIRFGEMTKMELPDGLIKEMEIEEDKKEKVAYKTMGMEEIPGLKVEYMDRDGQVRQGGSERSPLQFEIVELDDDEDVEHDEL